jgi:hypothetical protein
MVRYILGLAVLSSSGLAGCGVRPAALVAYARPATDVVLAERTPTRTIIEVERIPAAILGDATRLLALRLSMERQIGTQAKGIPEERYQRMVRPRLARELRSAGLGQVEVDGILRGVDYHRSL